MRAAVAQTVSAFGGTDILVNNAGVAVNAAIEDFKFEDYERMIAVNVTGVGRAFATALAKNNIRATLSNSRGPESLKDVVAAIGPTIEAGTREEAASKDIVLVASRHSIICNRICYRAIRARKVVAAPCSSPATKEDRKRKSAR